LQKLFRYCNKIFSEVQDEIKAGVHEFLPQQFKPGIICAQSKLKTQATCHGDSGSPFMIFNPTMKRFIQIGAVSGGLPVNQCGIKNNPTVLTTLNHPKTIQFIQSTFRRSGNANLSFIILKCVSFNEKSY